MMGIGVHEIQIGSGPALVTTTVGELKVSLHPHILAGRTLLGTTNSKWLRLRLWITYLGGPLMTFISGFIVWRAISSSLAAFGLALITGPALGVLFVIASAFFLFSNLLPLKGWGLDFQYKSDGLQLIRLPFVEDAAGTTIFRLGYLRAAKRAGKNADVSAVIGLCRTGLSKIPDDFYLMSLLATCLPRESDEKWQLIQTLIARDAPSAALRAPLLNSWAWECYERDDRSLIGEADARSREALELAPDSASFLDSRGHILIWMRRASEAIDPLTRAYEKVGDEGKAYAACGLALAKSAIGEHIEAERWLSEARKLAPSLPLVTRVAKQIAGDGDAPLVTSGQSRI
jgi:tetratricopeptide (TPR) repeat protein